MRAMVRCMPLFVLMLFSGALFAQDRAVPRNPDKGRHNEPAKEAPPRTAHPSPEAAAPNPNPAPRPPTGAQSDDSQRRRPRPDGRVTPRRPPSTQPDARARHPRPNPEHAYRERRFDWNYYQYEWWFGRDGRYLFPQRYDFRWRMLYRGFYMYPNARLPHPEDDGWFYWPYEDAPPRGCGWYWVPTRRKFIDGDEFGPHWQYWRFRYIYICVD